MSKPLLSIRDLNVSFAYGSDRRPVLEKFCLDVPEDETVALVGETGSGKTVAAMATLGLLHAPPAAVDAGQIWFDERDLLSLSERELQRVRGRHLAMVFQEPDAALDPYASVARLLTRAAGFHRRRDAGRGDIKRLSLDTLREVGFLTPTRVLCEFPHQLPEGERQRVLLAMALICSPKLLILDEPTAALDLPSRAQIVALLAKRKNARCSQLIISHDLGLVARTADEVYVMYAGRVVERGRRERLLSRPIHPYTRGLLASVPPAIIRGAPQERRLPTIPGSAERDTVSSGCRFRMRCAYFESRPEGYERCIEQEPELRTLEGARQARCHFAEDLA